MFSQLFFGTRRSRRPVNAPARTLAGIILLSVLCGGSWVQAQAQSDGQRYLKYVGKYIDAVFKADPSLKQRAQTLLGSNYNDFMGRMETVSAADKIQRFVVFEGCKAHECTHEDAYLILDVDFGKMYCAIYSDAYGAKNPRLFSEDPPNFPSKLLEFLHND